MKVDIKVLFYYKNPDNDPLGAKIIRWWTNSKYHHTEVFLENSRLIGATVENNVYSLPVTEVPANCDVIDLSINVTAAQLDIIENWVSSVVGHKYDYLGIVLSQVLPARIDSPSRWFCSELSTKILQLFVVKQVISLTPNMISPEKLHKALTT